MTVMEFINAHREDMEPCECVILPDGSVEEPQPSHIKKLEEISGEDKLTLNSRMEKNMGSISSLCALINSITVILTPPLFRLSVYSSNRIAQRIFVERALPFCTHSSAEGRITSFA